MPRPTKNVSFLFPTKSSNLSVIVDDEDFVDLEEGDEHKSNVSLNTNLTRAQSLILDYKQFKAARTIQRYARGWMVRNRQRKLEESAIVVQKWWRRFQTQRNFLFVVEKLLQEAMWAHYQRSATLVQTLYRGWWSRKHIFDLTVLKSLQNTLAKDLIHTLVKDLHSTKNSQLLPGVYTIRDSRICLKTLEQLMATFGYRYYNAQACYKMNKTLATVAQARKTFKSADFLTDIPYAGFNDRGFCVNKQLSSTSLNKRDTDHFELIRTFLAGYRKMDLSITAKIEQKAINLAEELRLIKIQERENKKKSFVKRIFLDMRNWHHPNGEPFLPSHIFKKNDMVVVLDNAKKALEFEFGQLEPCVCPTTEDLDYLANPQ
ncbi:uncharacterized protein LOC119546198 [Drosophila subpulchrella]|uniref:uncharacterized protein LOC119546198 n=1 Tax=Drosophila subpulchrella TaxID=1486046 RepID=UPI0018A18A52|nr:uncharacterized protein LOC119546198 [Drosophila subpulchrella]